MLKRLFIPIRFQIVIEFFFRIMRFICCYILSCPSPAFFCSIHIRCPCWKKHIGDIVSFQIFNHHSVFIPFCLIQKKKHVGVFHPKQFYIPKNFLFNLAIHFIKMEFSSRAIGPANVYGFFGAILVNNWSASFKRPASPYISV